MWLIIHFALDIVWRMRHYCGVMTTSDAITQLAQRYADHRQIALSTVGRLAMGHGHFFLRLEEGRVTIRRAERALQWFSAHWPEGLEWPADIPRPDPSENAGSPKEAA